MIKHLLRGILGLYRKYISPQLPRTCKYYPTCSAYAMEALEKHGAFKGLLLMVWRLLRCNPFSYGGYDPVPDEFFYYLHRRTREGGEEPGDEYKHACCEHAGEISN